MEWRYDPAQRGFLSVQLLEGEAQSVLQLSEQERAAVAGDGSVLRVEIFNANQLIPELPLLAKTESQGSTASSLSYTLRADTPIERIRLQRFIEFTLLPLLRTEIPAALRSEARPEPAG
jgi:hypothetical protein